MNGEKARQELRERVFARKSSKKAPKRARTARYQVARAFRPGHGRYS